MYAYEKFGKQLHDKQTFRLRHKVQCGGRRKNIQYFFSFSKAFQESYKLATLDFSRPVHIMDNVQWAKKVVSDSLELVDFEVRLLDSPLLLRDRQVKCFGKIFKEIQTLQTYFKWKNYYINLILNWLIMLVRIFWRLAWITFGLVYFGQAVTSKLTDWFSLHLI